MSEDGKKSRPWVAWVAGFAGSLFLTFLGWILNALEVVPVWSWDHWFVRSDPDYRVLGIRGVRRWRCRVRGWLVGGAFPKPEEA